MFPAWMDFMIKTVSELGRSYIRRPDHKHTAKSVNLLCQSLLTRRGEASGVALAKDIVDAYSEMDNDCKIQFLEMIASDFGPDNDSVAKAAQAYLNNPCYDSIKGLSKALKSSRVDLIEMLNFAPGGIEVIIQMRELVLQELKQSKKLLPLEVDLLPLLSAWFNRGFLEFRQITWNSPATVLEQVVNHEAVHEIKSWKDLQRRLGKDRNCFTFFHPALHQQPLIFVQVAYTKGIPRKIGPILAQENGELKTKADSAIFYSISNAQPGLKGISFGNFLIKQVVDHISKEMPEIKIFSTLSPIPRFVNWLQNDYLKRSHTLFTEDEWKLLLKPDWYLDEQIRSQLKDKLILSCAHYLTSEKKDNQPYDPVARFHLRNGAKIENINWEGDLSENGLHQSAGIMVNYKYTPSQIVTNHEAYINQGVIRYSSKIKKILE